MPGAKLTIFATSKLRADTPHRPATPSPRYGQPRAMINHARTTSGRTPTATPSPTSRATITPMSNHTQNDTQGAHTDRNTISPNGFRINDKPNLTASIPMGNSAAVAHL